MHRSSLVLLLTLTSLVLVSGYLSSRQQAEPGGSTFRLIPPEKIVNVVGDASFKKGHSTEVLYTVPDEHWFVLTGFRRIHTSKLDPELDLMMGKSGTKDLTLMVPYRLSAALGGTSYGDLVGLKFPPGSSVVLQRNERGSTTQVSQYLLVGYLIDV